MEYYAIHEDRKGHDTIYYLISSEEMDHYLGKGLKIYACQEGKDPGEGDQLIATPEDGYLVERPVFPVTESSRRNDGE